MRVLVLSQSPSYQRYLDKVFVGDVQCYFFSSIVELNHNSVKDISAILIHEPSFHEEIEKVLTQLEKLLLSIPYGVAADHPVLEDMLRFSGRGASSYFNSYMADIHYRQMLQFITSNQHWYIPGLLKSALHIASDVLASKTTVDAVLNKLTKRERDIALRVGSGQNNREIAEQCHITERTVKAHLTKIFKKTGVSDRVSLAILINITSSQARARLDNAL